MQNCEHKVANMFAKIQAFFAIQEKRGLLLGAKKQLLLILNASLYLKSVQCSIGFTGIQLQICFAITGGPRISRFFQAYI